ncbi:hypothetical protein D3C72_522510 [compost metagenome]
MNIDIEQSFVATLNMFDHKVNLLEQLHGKPALATVNLFSGGFFTGKPQTRDHSSLLGIRPNAQSGPVQPLKLHFLHTTAGYVLSIRNEGEHYNKKVSERWLEVLGTIDSEDDEPTVFTLVDQHNKSVTLKDFRTVHTPISLMTEDKKYVGGLTVKGSPYIYLANTHERSKITFIVSTLERKVSHSVT